MVRIPIEYVSHLALIRYSTHQIFVTLSPAGWALDKHGAINLLMLGVFIGPVFFTVAALKAGARVFQISSVHCALGSIVFGVVVTICGILSRDAVLSNLRQSWVSGPIAGNMKTRLFAEWQRPRPQLRSLGPNKTGVIAMEEKMEDVPWEGCELVELADVVFPYFDIQNWILGGTGIRNRWAGPWWCVGVAATGGSVTWRGSSGGLDTVAESLSAIKEPRPVLNGFGAHIFTLLSAHSATAAVMGSTRKCARGHVDLNAASRAYGMLNSSLDDADSWLGIVLSPVATDGTSLPQLPTHFVGNDNAVLGLLKYKNMSLPPLEALSLPVLLRIACPEHLPISYSILPDLRSPPFNVRLRMSMDVLETGRAVIAGAVSRTRIIPPRPHGTGAVVDVFFPGFINAQDFIVRCGTGAGDLSAASILEADGNASGVWTPADGTDRSFISIARPSLASLRRVALAWDDVTVKGPLPVSPRLESVDVPHPEDINKPSKAGALPLRRPPNVLVIVIDTLSRLDSLRKLPRSWAILKELRSSMDVFEQLRYHASGFSTGQSAVPLLTGWSEEGLAAAQGTVSGWPEVPKLPEQLDLDAGIAAARHAASVRRMSVGAEGRAASWRSDFSSNAIPIFRHFSRTLGYVSIVGLNNCDDPIAVFTGRLAPMDSHSNALWCLPPYHATWGPMKGVFGLRSRCLGGVHAHVPLLEWMSGAWDAYGQSTPKFGLLWLIDGHEALGEVIRDVDAALEAFLRSALLENRKDGGRGADDTIVLVMSDHGSHMSPGLILSTQGVVEHQLPLLVSAWPVEAALPSVDAEARRSLLANQHLLVGAADIFGTLHDLLSREERRITAVDPGFAERVALAGAECPGTHLLPAIARYDDSAHDFGHPANDSCSSAARAGDLGALSLLRPIPERRRCTDVGTFIGDMCKCV